MQVRHTASIVACIFGAAVVCAGSQAGGGRGTSVKPSGKQLKAHKGELHELAVSADGRVLASAGGDKVVRLWSLPGGEALQTLGGHTGRITSLAFTPDGRVLAAASEDKTISLWSVADGKRLATLTGHAEWIKGLRITPDGRFIVSQAGNELRTWSLPDGVPVQVSAVDHAGSLEDAALLPGGSTMAIKGAGGVALLSLPDLQQKAVVEAPSVRAIAASPDGVILFVATVDSVIVWSLAEGRSVGRAENVRGINVIALTPDGKTLVSGEASGAVRAWSVPGGDQVAVMEGHSRPVAALAISPDGRYVASGSHDSTARLWSLPGGTAVAVFQGHKGDVAHVRFTADGAMLITAQEALFQLTGPTEGGIGMRKINADAVIAVWSVSPPAFLRYVGR